MQTEDLNLLLREAPPLCLRSLAALTPKHLICPSCDTLDKGCVCLCWWRASRKKIQHQPSAPGHPITSHPISAPCTDSLAWSEWPSVPQKWVRIHEDEHEEKKKNTALLHPVWLLPGQRQKQERPGHLPHSVTIEVLWGTDLPKVSSSVSNKRLPQPSPVGHQDLCGGSVNGKKIVEAFQGHMQMKSQSCRVIFKPVCLFCCAYTDFNRFSNGSWIPNSSRSYLSADCLVAHFSTLECLQSLPTLARVRIDFSFGRFSFSSSFLPQISVKRKMSGTEGLIRT